VGALHHVLHGRLFVPSLESLFHLANGGGHAMQLYSEPGSFLDGLAAFFDLALRRGDATCIIATEDVRDGLTDRLRTRGWNVAGASNDRWRFVDAVDALDSFMRNDRPDRLRLGEIVSELDRYRRAVSDGPTSHLTLFGTMADLLCRAGNPEAVLALERTWNALTHNLPFFTLCGYSTTSSSNQASEFWSDACAEHWAVSPAMGT
jgi:hypothetical protein